MFPVLRMPEVMHPSRLPVVLWPAVPGWQMLPVCSQITSVTVPVTFTKKWCTGEGTEGTNQLAVFALTEPQNRLASSTSMSFL